MDEISEQSSSPVIPSDDFDLLSVRYLDGLTNPEEARYLERQLESSDERRDRFAALCVQVGVLGEMVIANGSHNEGLPRESKARQAGASLASPLAFPDLCGTAGGDAIHHGSSDFVNRVLGRSMRFGGRWLRATSHRIIAASLVILALTAGLVWMWPDQASELHAQREPQLIASLTNGSQATWSDGFAFSDGAQFSEGQVLKLAEGQAQVSISCGAEVIMRAPCTIEFVSPNQLLLHEGLLSVQLADWTSNFTVATESLQILDLGKQFVVTADANSGAVEAHAIDGKLRVQSKNATDDNHFGMLVTEGEAIRIQPASNTPMRLKANGHLFDATLDDSRPYKPIEINNTGRGLTPGDEDPNWRIISSSADDFAGARYAVACRQYTSIYLPNEPDVSQWISTTNPVDDNCPPNTMYTFETEFDLSTYDLSTVTIVAHVLADNGVMGVRINGHYVAFKPWSAVYGLFDTYHKIEISDGFVQGVNRIQFDVWNSIVMSYPNDDNPMALRVEWQAYGRLKRREMASNLPDRGGEPDRRQLVNIAHHNRYLPQLLTSPAAPPTERSPF